MDELNAITSAIRARLTEKDAARDAAVRRSREVIRLCSEAIRAVHRSEWAEVDVKLEAVRATAQEMREGVSGYPDLYHSGYTQDALKEVVEAFLTSAMIRRQPLPTPDILQVEDSTYLNGMAEAATELRRYILDIMRQKDMRVDEAERLLAWMDAVYDELVTFDFPDAITGGLRRQTDLVRGVLERTRGDLTTSLRQLMLQEALQRFEARVVNDR
jgi:translin